tara:strand:- start:44 stop:202 length:159 start_codon:yes stop_codon:yes gene_type:complete
MENVMSNTFKIILILILLFLIFTWMNESEWMEENWPELEMNLFWDEGELNFK